MNGRAVSHTTGTDAEPHGAKLGLVERADSSLAIVEGASCRVVFDGVLYNHAELSNRFAASSTPTANDAALILQAYLAWGEKLLHKIEGIFALLIWDERRDALLCARDPLGVHPLFYADAGYELLFSNSIEALIRRPEVSDTVNRAALADRLCYRSPTPEETYFEAVNRVLPGHIMSVNGTGGRQEYRYWDPVPDPTAVNWIGEDELEQFDELLDQAVDRCLQLGQAGIFLSGGLDSVSVAAVAADSCRRKGLPDPLALSVIFPTPETNEEAIQRSVASSLGLPHEMVPLGEAIGIRGILQSAIETSSGWPTPLSSLWGQPIFVHLGREAKRRDCRVIMTGHGGDEWLGVSNYYAADLLRAMDIGGLYRLWSSSHHSHNVSRLALMRDVLWRFGARPWLGVATHTALRWAAPSLLGWHLRRRISRSTPEWVAPDPTLRQEIDQRTEQSLANSESRSFYLDQVRLFLDHSATSMVMEGLFEMGRRMGVPILAPFFDADLVDFLYRTPPELLNGGGRSKGLVRQTVARQFPGLGFERQKKVTSGNLVREIFLEEAPPLWQKMGGAQALAELGIVDAPALNAATSALFSGSQPHYIYRIRSVLLTEAWLRSRL